MRYRIRFYGTPVSWIPEREIPIRKSYCSRVVEAESVEAARLDAYRTHEHIHGTILCDLPCETCDSRDCNQCAGTGWISSARYNSPDSLEKQSKIIFSY